MIHTLHRMAQGCCACHLIHAWSVRFTFDFESSIPFYFLIFSLIFNLLHFFLHFFHNLEGSSDTAYFAWKEMDSSDGSYLFTGYEPKNYDLKEIYVESYTESLTHPKFSEQGFLEDVEYDDSQREGLSDGQSLSSVSERTGRSVGERTGRLVGPIGQELNVANAQIRTLLDRQKGQILAECQAKLRNTNSRLIVTVEVYENRGKLFNLSKKNFIALKLKNFNDEINNFFMKGYCSKIRNYVKLIIKVSMKWKC